MQRLMEIEVQQIPMSMTIMTITIPKIVWTKILILTEMTIKIRAIAKAGPVTTNLH